MSGQTTPWEAGGVTRDRFVTAGTKSEGIFSLGDVNIFPASGPGPVAIAAGADIAAQIVKAVNSHEALVAELQRLFELYGHQATADVLASVGLQKVSP